MNAVDMFNAFEVGLWTLLAAIVGVLVIREPQRQRRWLLVSGALALLAFAGSDYVEFYTGAWWRPWWLLCWKVACIVTLVAIVVIDYRHRKLRD